VPVSEQHQPRPSLDHVPEFKPTYRRHRRSRVAVYGRANIDGSPAEAGEWVWIVGVDRAGNWTEDEPSLVLWKELT
jgi:hypothetical protein